MRCPARIRVSTIAVLLCLTLAPLLPPGVYSPAGGDHASGGVVPAHAAPERRSFAAEASRPTWADQSTVGTNALVPVATRDARPGPAAGGPGTAPKEAGVSDGVWTWQNPLPIGNPLNSVAFVDSQTGWAVGDWGTILKTSNGGDSWTVQNSDTTEDLHSVAFVGAQTGWAVGEGGTILKTSNGGATWNPQSSGTSTRLYSVAFTDAQTGWAVAWNGSILKTTNGGITWAPQSSGTGSWLESVAFVDALTGWAVGGQEYPGGGGGATILKTNDGGTTWIAQPSATMRRLTAVAFVSAQTGWAVGEGGTIVKTTNGGTTWTAQSSGASSSLYSVAFVDAQTGWAVGAAGTILKTTNGGATWAPQSSGPGNLLSSVAFVDPETGWAVGVGGTILKTANGGATWTAQSSSTRSDLRSIFFANAQTGWAAGDNGVTFKTANGGVSWIGQFPSGGYWYRSVAFVDAQTGWAVDHGGRILKTSNGGSTWAPQTSGTTNQLNSVVFVDAQTGWVVGDGGTILKTANGGSTWAAQTSGTTNQLNSVAFVDAQTGWVAGDGGTILKTSDGGINWTPQASGTLAWLQSVAFVDAQTGWAVGGRDSFGLFIEATILKTSDGGTTWTAQTPDTDNCDLVQGSYCINGLFSVAFVDAQTGWAVGQYGTILKTGDGGVTWASQASGTRNRLYSVAFVDAQTGWAVGQYGTILKHGAAPLNYAVSGRATDIHRAAPNGLPGVTISAGPGLTTITDSGGYYTLTVAAGTHSLTASKAGYTFSKLPPVSGPPGATGRDFEGSNRTPIVFVPGFGGSRLFNTVDGQEEEVWLDLQKAIDGAPLAALGLKSDGQSPLFDEPAYSSVHVKDGSSGLLTRTTGWVRLPGPWYVDDDYYDTLVKFFTNNTPDGQGYKEGVDFWIYPYDWRKDVHASADGLAAFIQRIGDEEVRIVAHSMGGLVARDYISRPGGAARVAHAIFLGTPFLGTPRSFEALQLGICLGGGPLCVPPKYILRDLIDNWAGAYYTMPSRAYFAIKGSGFYGIGPRLDVGGNCAKCLDFDGTYTTSIVPDLNTNLAGVADSFHVPMDTSGWNGVPVSLVVGIGQKTIAGIRQYPVFSSTRREPVYLRLGDGTVTALSAGLGPTNGFNYRGNASYKEFEYDHFGLVKEREVLDYVLGELGIATAQSARAVVQAASTVSGAQISGVGVASIDAYDDEGRHTGPVPGTTTFEVGIRGSAYFNDGDFGKVALAGGRTYTITVQPTGNAPVDITLERSTATQTLTTTLFLGIPATGQSAVRLVGDPYVADSWQLDRDGTGSDTQSLAPTSVFTSSAGIDSLPPTATITLQGARGANGWYTSPVTVSISASDNITGTGISRIEYAFANDRQIRVYSEPFVVDPGQVSTISVAALDRAGNYQFPIKQARIGPDRVYVPLATRNATAGW